MQNSWRISYWRPPKTHHGWVLAYKVIPSGCSPRLTMEREPVRCCTVSSKQRRRTTANLTTILSIYYEKFPSWKAEMTTVICYLGTWRELSNLFNHCFKMTDTALVGGICVGVRKSRSRFSDAYKKSPRTVRTRRLNTSIQSSWPELGSAWPSLTT